MVAENKRPAFITFTGIDEVSLINGIKALSREYPIEWGVLIDRNKKGVPLFPSEEIVQQFRKLGVRLSAHICGDLAREIAQGGNPDIELAGFSRIQVNYSRTGGDLAAASAVSRYSARQGVRGALQCNGEFPISSTKVDWLFDVSFGEGVRPKAFPELRSDHPFCGFSGGIDPDNVATLLNSRIINPQGFPFWIDMESGVRTGSTFDLDKCHAICQAVYDRFTE